MPKFSHASLSSDFELVLAPDLWDTTLVSADSEHTGALTGGLISIHKVICDFTGLTSTTTDIDLMDIPAGENWYRRVIGTAIWANIIHNGTGLLVSLGTNSPNYNDIQPNQSVVSATEASWGDDLGDVSFDRGERVGASGTVKAHWTTDASTMSGAITLSFWGYLLPDITVAGA